MKLATTWPATRGWGRRHDGGGEEGDADGATELADGVEQRRGPAGVSRCDGGERAAWVGTNTWAMPKPMVNRNSRAHHRLVVAVHERHQADGDGRGTISPKVMCRRGPRIG